MKTKLLRRLKKSIKKYIKKDCVLTPQTYDAANARYINDDSRLVYLDMKKPIAPLLWKELDIRSNWFVRYWKHSKWRSRIEVISAAKGISIDAAVLEVLDERRRYQAKHPNIVVPSLHKVVPTLIPKSAIQPNSTIKPPISFNAIFGK